VYIYDMSGDVERIRTPILSLPIIAYFARDLPCRTAVDAG